MDLQRTETGVELKYSEDERWWDRRIEPETKKKSINTDLSRYLNAEDCPTKA